MSTQTETLFSKFYTDPAFEDEIQPDTVTREMLAIGMPYTLVNRTYGRGKMVELLPHTDLQFILDLYGACTLARIWVGGRTLAQAWDGLDTRGATDESPGLQSELVSWRQWLVGILFPYLEETEFVMGVIGGRFYEWIQLPFQKVAPLLMHYVDLFDAEADSFPSGSATIGAAAPARLVAVRLHTLFLYEMEYAAREEYRKLHQTRQAAAVPPQEVNDDGDDMDGIDEEEEEEETDDYFEEPEYGDDSE